MDIDEKHAGITHVSYKVRSIPAAKEFLAEAGIPLTGEFSFKGLHAVFIRDPDLNVIELDGYKGEEPDTRTDSDTANSIGYDEHPVRIGSGQLLIRNSIGNAVMQGQEMRLKILLVVLLFAGIANSQESVEPKPQVLIMTTGGTIASRTDAPLIDGPQLVQAVPQLLDFADVRVDEFSVIGSSKMTPDHWLRLAKRINETFSNDKDLAGIVITHGTDTLEETAYFLNLTIQSDRPVILVGSMRSSNEVSGRWTCEFDQCSARGGQRSSCRSGRIGCTE